MGKFNNIVWIEIELTSFCNAACPGCRRTFSKNKYDLLHLTLSDIKKFFPNKDYIENKHFRFSGVLGEPIVNPECLDITKYFLDNNGAVSYSTNGGAQSIKWWNEVGILSNSTKKLKVDFCVDGYEETNHIYRVNTNFKKINENMQAYSNMKGNANWVYIVFEHNEHELELAKERAKELNFNFQIRTGMRNSMNEWTSKSVKIKESKNYKHETQKEVKKLIKFAETKNKSVNEKTKIIDTMKCRYIHDNEIFIASNKTLWPCCFFWDSAVVNKNNFLNTFIDYNSNWNNLENNNIEDILQHEYFSKILEQSWNPEHPLHVPRCIVTCGNNAAYQNKRKQA